MAKKKLSKSACEKWMACPASYDYHYNQRIRPIRTGTALTFGSGIDNAFNALLTKQGDPLEEYKKAWLEVPVGLSDPHHADYDGELLSDDQKAALLNEVTKFGYSGDNVDSLAYTLMDKHRAQEKLSDNQYKALDVLCRASLEEKAKLFIQAYIKHILPMIEEVHSVQEKAGPGVLDAVVNWKFRGKIIVDHKTASKLYPENAVEFSVQLAMYADEMKINDVAYIVFLKMIRKNRIRKCVACGSVCENNRVKSCDQKVDDDGKESRCGGDFAITIKPEAEFQVVHGTITNEAMAVARELQSEVARAVEAKIFPCNVAQCNSQFGKPCIYRDLKWKGDMSGLKKLEGK
jgi:hypothetical protein